ncbi:related to small nuclear ribonucleoprotein U2B [Cephalotrichum gorgonifer]|uniref:Related to small nuclear ribonucleoprotein U2B n=1 Tax=Cephalotrichum gorgonifer TaxID=2041049 RepID=A0AAE8MQB3_9PEZI|nr:related to small nuclear ribonucleoprotein U2B [Cephalotrichum gorgonifer]
MASAIPSRGLPANPSLPAKVQPIPPNQTLYITNLPSAKIKKPDLRTALYLLFSAYGPVLDIVVLKTMKMRGQAHIVYRDIQTSTQAMRSLNGFEFLGRPMKVEYAKSKSNFVSKLDGTFKLPMSGATDVEVTDLQSSIFNAPAPGTAAAAKAPAVPARQVLDRAAERDGTPDSRGQKRAREEESEEESDSDVAMEEDSDED